MKLFVLLNLLTFFSHLALGREFLQLNPQDFATANQTSLSNANSWLDTVESQLPPILLQRFTKQKLQIRFVNLDKKHSEHGESDPQVITLNYSLLNEYFSGLPKSAKFLSLGFLPTTSLLHELAHKYDRLGVAPLEYLKTRKHCIQAAISNHIDTSPECQKITRIETSVSDLREYQVLADFQESGFIFRSIDRSNFFLTGSPDTREWQSPFESFAVNFVYYILDPEYACRRPGLYRYLSQHFKMTNQSQANSCQTNSQFFISSGPEQFKSLDFSRLYAIHYLFAGEGDEILNSFGHAMLRLVFCAPERSSLDEKCLTDISHHYIVSPAAFISDVVLDSYKGLTGAYAFSHYLLSFNTVMNEYRKTEFRYLKSLPLQMSRGRLKILFENILYKHWTFDGRYYFLTANCATEILDLLKRTFYDIPKLFDLEVDRPDSLYAALIKTGLGKMPEKPVEKSDPTAVDPLEASTLFMPEQRNTYAKVLGRLFERGAIPENYEVLDYLEVEAEQRTKWIQEQIQRKSKNDPDAGRNLMGFSLLEELIIDRIIFKAKEELFKKMADSEESQKMAADPDPQKRKLMEYVRDTLLDLRPYLFWNHHQVSYRYGIPTETEIANLNAKISKTKKDAAVSPIADPTDLNKSPERLSELNDIIVSQCSEDARASYAAAKGNVEQIQKNY